MFRLLVLTLLLVATLFAVGCERRVVSQKKYSPEQFPEYEEVSEEEQQEEPGLFEKMFDDDKIETKK